MKRLSKIHLIAFVILIGALSSCIKKEEYPIEPQIQYLGLGVYKTAQGYDSAGVIKISFTDGDGDIGLYDYDTVEPYKYNFFLRFLEQTGGQLQEVKLPDTNLSFNARIPILTPTGKNKNISGQINMLLELYYAWSVLKSDTIAFEIYIKDRALHSSNMVRSPLYIISKP